MRTTSLLATSLLVAACSSPELRPAPGAMQVPGNESAATATEAGVLMTVDGGAWTGVPDELDTVVPVKVSIQNDSGRALRIRYDAFALAGPQGTLLAALPPLQIDGTALVEGSPVFAAGPGTYPYSGGVLGNDFYLAPSYGPYYSGFNTWTGPFAYDMGYYGSNYGAWPVQLPTASMVEQALPEGVIDASGSAQGFLYFQDVPEGLDRVAFRAELVDASTGETFGVISIPFIPEDA